MNFHLINIAWILHKVFNENLLECLLIENLFSGMPVADESSSPPFDDRTTLVKSTVKHSEMRKRNAKKSAIRHN